MWNASGFPIRDRAGKSSGKRIVFFLEEAPNELKAIVEFLNKQMVSSEVLLVEARQYEQGSTRIVVPSLFGFTEQARRVKQTVTVTPRERRWDWNGFEADSRKKGLSDADCEAMKNLLEACQAMTPEPEVVWGVGKVTGSYSVRWPAISSGSILSVYSNGYLEVGFANLNRSDSARLFKDKLQEVARKAGLAVSENPKFPQYKLSEWGPNVDSIIHGLAQLVSQGVRKAQDEP